MSTLRLTFHGGAGGHVTGSMHLLEAAGARILLDSGLFQGRRKEAYRFNATLPVDPRQLDAIVLSHAHIDHSGRLPLLVSRGFHGPIYSTAATRAPIQPTSRKRMLSIWHGGARRVPRASHSTRWRMR
jgi:metallo-beta-lactamase family protein